MAIITDNQDPGFNMLSWNERDSPLNYMRLTLASKREKTGNPQLMKTYAAAGNLFHKLFIRHPDDAHDLLNLVDVVESGK